MSTAENQQEPKAPLSLVEAFKERHSVRTYQGQNLTQEQKDIIAQSITEANSLETPFHSQGVEVSSTEPGLGRMGFISGEAGWIVEKLPIAQDQQDNDAERKRIIDVSYIAQHVVMKLAQNHINTVWIAGTYNEGEAEKRFQGFKVPAAIAYGIEQSTPHFMGRIIKLFGSSTGKRIPFEQLFYDNDNKRLITEKDFESPTPDNIPSYPSYLKDFLASLRLGPSAVNQQPWRFVLSGKEVHLFDVKSNNYSAYDIGIALANLHLLGEIRGGNCTFEIRDPAPETSPLNGTYVATAVYQE
ncbi:hypothetical protein M9Y10_011510 [Tritrichomonas musculus]|uniref:Putative nitroreductase TM1586 domain-containing protein n=1 Tax=Tritrichomonas musculus TaxID=1915356 RepID=A0ABR2IKD1_9EUKA